MLILRKLIFNNMEYLYRKSRPDDKGCVFFDFDDFLFWTNQSFVKFISDSFQVRLTCKELALNQDIYGLVSSLGVELGVQEFWQFVQKNYLLNLKYHEDVMPVRGVTEFVPKLAEDYLLVIVTNRQREGKFAVEYLLDRYLPNCFHGIHFVHSKLSVTLRKPDFISGFCSPSKKLCFFDDHIKEIETVTKHVPSILFNPFGWHDYPQDKMVTDWNGVYKKILELS